MPQTSARSPTASEPSSASSPAKMSKARANDVHRKAKGAVRAKSGCYTCRIRRKKCDEKPDGEGNCQTCVRLRLQCLGFGAKRPDWMREGNNVVELREKIKNFLASQGMIKGHSGQPSSSGQRAGSGSDQGDNEGSPGGNTTSAFGAPPHAVGVVAAAAASASTSTIGSGPNGNHVLVLSQSHRNVPYPMNSPPARTHSISPGNTPINGNGAFAAGTSASARYSMENGTRRGGYGTVPSISTAGAGAAATGFGNGYMDPHSPHSRRSPSDSSLDERVNLLGIENDPYSSRPPSVHGYRTHPPPAYRHHISVVTNGAPTSSSSSSAACLPSPSPSLSGSSPGANALYRQLPRTHPYTPAPEPHLDVEIVPTDNEYNYNNQWDGYFINAVPMSSSSSSSTHPHFGYARPTVQNHSPQFGINQLSPDSPKAPHGLRGNPLFGQQQLGPHQGHLASQHYGNHYGTSADGVAHTSPPCNENRQEQLRYAHTHFNHRDDSSNLQRFAVEQYHPPYPPSIHSTYSDLYHLQIPDESDQNDTNNMLIDTRGIGGVGIGALDHYSGTQALGGYSSLMFPLMDPNMGMSFEANNLLKHYLKNVRPMQYFFAGSWIDENIFRLAQNNDIVRDSICLVASVHKHRWNNADSPPHPPLALPEGDDAESKKYAQRVRERLLRRFSQNKNAVDIEPGEALAGLQCVSSFLFAGGMGEWDKFLEIACLWVSKVLNPARRPVGGYASALRTLDPLSHFIVKATMWFEVLASVTKIEAPRFLTVYEELFEATRIVDPEGELDIAQGHGMPMLDVMGCDDLTFLAIAKISALAAWKEENVARGTLDVMDLVEKGLEIQTNYLQSPNDPFSMHRMPLLEDTLPNRKRLTADIFHAAARLYLNTVLSGDKPTVPKISRSVRETVDALKQVPKEPNSLRQSVVRSVVFPICIAGCMTDDPEQRQSLLDLLEETPGAGNCNAVAQVMKDVWARRDPPPGNRRHRPAQPRDVSWRQALRENGALLLV